MTEGPAGEPAIGFGLLTAMNLLSRPFVRSLGKDHDLTLSEWRMLMLVAGSPGITAAEAADLTGMDRMAASRAAQRLSRQGRLSRGSDAGDRRRQPLHLTAAGRALYDALIPAALARHEAMLADLNAAERVALQMLLDKIVATLRRAPDG